MPSFRDSTAFRGPGPRTDVRGWPIHASTIPTESRSDAFGAVGRHGPGRAIAHVRWSREATGRWRPSASLRDSVAVAMRNLGLTSEAGQSVRFAIPTRVAKPRHFGAVTPVPGERRTWRGSREAMAVATEIPSLRGFNAGLAMQNLGRTSEAGRYHRIAIPGRVAEATALSRDAGPRCVEGAMRHPSREATPRAESMLRDSAAHPVGRRLTSEAGDASLRDRARSRATAFDAWNVSPGATDARGPSREATACGEPMPSLRDPVAVADANLGLTSEAGQYHRFAMSRPSREATAC